MIQYSYGYKYQLLRDATFVLPAVFGGFKFMDEFVALDNCVLSIKKGYAWDGPSGPTIDTKNGMQGSLAHDALYQAMRENLLPRTLKPFADDFFRDQCREDGMSKLRSWIWWKGVQDFGMDSTIANKDILVAP